ncbi:MAG: twin transmembrane helix small protein [Candidatus Parcubacteria bacterium]|nr:twin transmembrane helix small protein [Burkholderiales bacterium]
MRYVVFAMLVMIGASLASALVFMVKGRDDPKRMAKALTVRIALSVGLFLLLMAGYYFGLVPGRL